MNDEEKEKTYCADLTKTEERVEVWRLLPIYKFDLIISCIVKYIIGNGEGLYIITQL